MMPECHHVFHSECFKEWLETTKNHTGPPTRESLMSLDIKCPHCSIQLRTKEQIKTSKDLHPKAM